MSLGASLIFPPSSLPKLMSTSPFTFLFAPHYHPSLAHLAPIRRQLNFRTVFNVLGPLINPARPQRMVLGVAKKELGDTFAEVLKLLKVERALVVCGKEGLDEISCEGETWVSGLVREHAFLFIDCIHFVDLGAERWRDHDRFHTSYHRFRSSHSSHLFRPGVYP
jgi:anthranilate phosphoribosyltransferase